MTSLRAIAVDDSPHGLDVIRLHAARIPFLDLVATLRTPLVALEAVRTEEIDLVLLDIEMPEIRGLDLAEMLRPTVQVVFTTAYSEHAVESYRLDATDFLTKPIEFERFLQSINRVLDRKLTRAKAAGSVRAPESPTLDFWSGKTLYRLSRDEILYLEGRGNYVKIVCRDRSVMVHMTMKTAERRLCGLGFARSHRSFIVALHAIEAAERRRLRVGGRLLPIGESYRRSILDQLGEGCPRLSG